MSQIVDETTDFQETRQRIADVYGEVPDLLADGLEKLIQKCRDESKADSGATSGKPLWDHRDVVLITYGDQVRDPQSVPLKAQHDFLVRHRLQELIRCVHLLPFCPSTSDDGFSVADYLAVDPECGALGRHPPPWRRL